MNPKRYEEICKNKFPVSLRKSKAFSKRAWSFIGLFIIALVISMPFYVADVYAVSVKVVKNQGEEGIEGFIDGEGDIWTVEAEISGLEEGQEVKAEEVKLEVGTNEDPFDGCSSSALGTVCEHVSTFSSGLDNGMYTFKVLYYPSAGDFVPSKTEVIKIDGTGPAVTGLVVKQEGQEVKLDFEVQDEPKAYCVGLEKVEVIDAEAGVLETIDGFEEGDCDYDYNLEQGGILPAKLEGEGKRFLRVEATDKFGHKGIGGPKQLTTDFVAPEILGESLELKGLGEFVGTKKLEVDINFKVKEKGNKLGVTGSSEQVELEGAAECEEGDEGIWECAWRKVELTPASSIVIEVEAEDGYGNVGTGTLRKEGLVVDEKAPVADFLGTVRVFEEVSYVSTDAKVKNRIILKARDEGVGIDKDGVRANLKEIGGGVTGPEECEQDEEGNYVCYWEVYASTGGTIWLSIFEDKVENAGAGPGIEGEIEGDGSNPVVEKLAVYGVGGEAGKKDYFQSEDELSLELTVTEKTGLFFLVDLNELVLGAEDKYPDEEVKKYYPEGGEDYSGWQLFKGEEVCEEEEGGKKKCELGLGGIKSVASTQKLKLKVKVFDTAGNSAGKWPEEGKVKNVEEVKDGEYKLELLAVKDETEPEYWAVKRVNYAPEFVDLDTTNLINTRISAQVVLDSDKAIAKKIELVGNKCFPAAEGNASTVGLTRSLLYGGISETEGEASPTIVLEFESFDGKETFLEVLKESGEKTVKIPYTCQLRIYSQVGKKAIKSGELEEVELAVEFGFSVLGAQDENLEEKVKEIKDEALFKIADKLKILSKIIQWLKWLADIVEVIFILDNILVLINSGGDKIRGVPLVGIAVALGLCKGTIKTKMILNWVVQIIQIPLALLTCNPDPDNLGWYGLYQSWILKGYNYASGRFLIGFPAESLYENIYTSLVGVCIPGIIYNLERYRQVRCREIVCLKNEVPAGIATVDSCVSLGSYLKCRFFLGPLVELTLLNTIDQLTMFIKSLFTSPLGFIRLALQIPCLAVCGGSNTAASICMITGTIINIGNLLNTIVGAFYSRPSLAGDPYCSQID